MFEKKMMQKRIAASILKISPKRIVFDPEHLKDIKEAITKADIRGLINKGYIKEKPVKGTSRFRARIRAIQKRKGRRKGHGSRKGAQGARLNKKTAWMNKIRAQRKFLKVLKENNYLNTENYRSLYLKAKGGFFRNIRHIKLYIKEYNLTQNEKKT